jgi:hypothetical protein
MWRRFARTVSNFNPALRKALGVSASAPAGMPAALTE